MKSKKIRFYFELVGIVFVVVILNILAKKIFYDEPSSSVYKTKINSSNGYARLVRLGKMAQNIYPIKGIKVAETSEQKKVFTKRQMELIYELKDILQVEIVLQDEHRPNTYKEHGRDTFLHFKPLAALLRDLCTESVNEKNSRAVLENAVLLISLGKAICYGGDRDDQNIGFVFITQGTTLLYKYLRTQPDDLKESDSIFLSNLKDHIESASVTIGRLPDSSANNQYDAVNKRSIEIQNNRISAIYACLDMCQIAFELELYRKSFGKYPETLQDIKCSPSLLIDSWQQPYVYIAQKNSYQLYSKGIDQTDNNGNTPSIEKLAISNKGDLDIDKL
ncbi:MAG: type II secretion system protein GspG [Planctomycetaceae bacterium]|jgi:hypothetical protein|nr:type II secretion system protein GspG [Planctomycetaceae bacterium]